MIVTLAIVPASVYPIKDSSLFPPLQPFRCLPSMRCEHRVQGEYGKIPRSQYPFR